MRGIGGKACIWDVHAIFLTFLFAFTAALVFKVDALVGPAADIWSIGCCIYEFAMAVRLFRPSTPFPPEDARKQEQMIGALVQKWQQGRSASKHFIPSAPHPCNRLKLLLDSKKYWAPVVWSCCDSVPTSRPKRLTNLAFLVVAKACLPMPWCLASAPFQNTRDALFIFALSCVFNTERSLLRLFGASVFYSGKQFFFFGE